MKDRRGSPLRYISNSREKGKVAVRLLKLIGSTLRYIPNRRTKLPYG